MNQDPLVSIIMPVHNCEKFLKEAMDSILKQTYKNFELILINDGSTDNTQKIIDQYTDHRIRTFKQENMGVSRSLNKAIGLAKGEYIRRHDADDKSYPNMLETQIKFLQDHPEIDLVSTQIAFMSPNGKVAPKHRQPKQNIFENKEFIIVNREHFNPYTPIVHGTVLGPTKIFKEFNGYRTEFLTSEDSDLWLRIIEKYNFAILNTCPYFLRLSDFSATQTNKFSLEFYRELAMDCHRERISTGSDIIMRGEKIAPNIIEETIKNKKIGRTIRRDLLDYRYKVMINAKDYKEIVKIIIKSLISGFLKVQTYKLIIIPLIGKNLSQKVVHIKRKIKKSF